MTYRPHPKRASVDPSNPRAWGTCDRSGFIHQWVNLVPEYAWEGTQLVNQNILVGPQFVDIPNEQFRSIRLPPDPPPILNARPEPYSVDEGLMPLTTEPGYPGDPGQVLRVDGVRPGTPPAPGESTVGKDPTAGEPDTVYIGVEIDTSTNYSP